jgi:hypothetical protein
MNSEQGNEREKRRKKISSNSYYHITLNYNSRKQHIVYKLILFSSLLFSQLCFIVPTFKYSFYLSNDTYPRLFFVIKLFTTTTTTTNNHMQCYGHFFFVFYSLLKHRLLSILMVRVLYIGYHMCSCMRLKLKRMLIRKRIRFFYLLFLCIYSSYKSDNIRNKILSKS